MHAGFRPDRNACTSRQDSAVCKCLAIDSEQQNLELRKTLYLNVQNLKLLTLVKRLTMFETTFVVLNQGWKK